MAVSLQVFSFVEVFHRLISILYLVTVLCCAMSMCSVGRYTGCVCVISVFNHQLAVSVFRWTIYWMRWFWSRCHVRVGRWYDMCLCSMSTMSTMSERYVGCAHCRLHNRDSHTRGLTEQNVKRAGNIRACIERWQQMFVVFVSELDSVNQLMWSWDSNRSERKSFSVSWTWTLHQGTMVAPGVWKRPILSHIRTKA